MKKFLLVFLTIVIFAGWGCGKNNATNTIPAETPVMETPVTEAEDAIGLSYEVATIHEESEEMMIDILYPVFTGEDILSANINNRIKPFIDELMEDFMYDFQNTTHDYDGGAWFLEIDYVLPRNDDSFVSLVLTGGIYTGGAHPNQFYKTFLFNLEEDGVLMNTAEMFNPTAMVIDADSGAYIDWLNYISSKARLQLMQQEYADADWINEGAGPQAANFALFYLTDKEIVFLFPPYQVAPYAAGPQQVQFTIDELAEYLRAYNF